MGRAARPPGEIATQQPRSS